MSDDARRTDSGIEIRPLPTLAGESEFSEVFLDNVRIPVENLVGQENDGWRVTNVTLRFERGTAFASAPPPPPSSWIRTTAGSPHRAARPPAVACMAP